MKGRIFFGPAGTELLGHSANGVPIVADQDGAGEMSEITSFVVDLSFGISNAVERVQLSRRRGWRKPANTIVVARPSKWGNPFRVGAAYRVMAGERVWGELIATPEVTVALFRRYIEHYKVDVTPLRGHNLACWCPLDQPCHADVLLEIANRPEPGT